MIFMINKVERLVFDILLWIRVKFGVKLWLASCGQHGCGIGRAGEAEGEKDKEEYLCRFGNNISVNVYHTFIEY